MRSRGRGSFVMFAVFLIIALVLGACTTPPAAPVVAPTAAPTAAPSAPTAEPAAATGGEVEIVRIGLQPWLGYGPWWVADKQGFFKARGVNAEVVEFTWDQDMQGAFAAGHIDINCSSTNQAINARAQGLDVQAFLLMDASYAADAILAPKTIQTIQDLKGKQVAYEQGSTSDLLLNYALREAGLTIDDITVVPMSASDAGAALIAGKVDIAVTYEPYISAALANKPDFGILYSAEARPGLISDVSEATREFIKNNPETIRKLVLAWDDSIQFLREHPEEGNKIIADAVGSDMDEFMVAMAGVKLYDLAENKAEFAGGPYAAAFEDIGKIMMSVNPDLKSVPAASDFIVTDFVK